MSPFAIAICCYSESVQKSNKKFNIIKTEKNMYSHDITAILIVLGTAVILPITIVFLTSRRKMQSEKNKKEIILAALEKNADIDIEELVNKMNKPEKLLKEKLLNKLQWGMLTMFLGIGLIGFAIYLFVEEIGGIDSPMFCFLWGIAAFAIGIAFLANYHIGKKMLAKEMEAEEQKMRQSKQ